MLTQLRWLGLRVEAIDPAHHFYGDVLGLPLRAETQHGRHYGVGETELRLHADAAAGGEHVHYAFSTAADAYETWRERLSDRYSVEEHDFGVYRSLYVFDPDDHCVEIAGRDAESSRLTGIFEVVLEVESLVRAERFYRPLTTDVLDRGDKRRRVRLDTGALELELWEPQRGLAGARGGETVDLGIAVRDLEAVVERFSLRADAIEPEGADGYRIVDPDGHVLTLVADTQ